MTFNTFSHFNFVNKTKILMKFYKPKPKQWCDHTPYIALSLTSILLPQEPSQELCVFLTQVTHSNHHLFSPNLFSPTSHIKHMLQLLLGSAAPWKHKVSVRQCRPESGLALAGQTGKLHCAAHGPWRRPRSEDGPQPVKVQSGSRWHPGTGKGGCSPCR